MSVSPNRQVQSVECFFQFRPQLLNVIVVHQSYILLRIWIRIPVGYRRQAGAHSQLIYRRAQLGQVN